MGRSAPRRARVRAPSVAVADWEFMESSEEKVEYLREGMAHAAALAAEAKRA